MKKIQLSTVLVMFTVAVVALYLGNKLFELLKISIRNMDFTYINDSKKTQRWIDYMTPLAKEVGGKMGIPWQAMVVQTAIETGWGKSSLFQKYNNFGGIKAVGSQPSVSLGTTECGSNGCYQTTSKFRKWNTKYDGLIGYAQFFKDNGRYATALKYPNDPYRFVEEIKKAGYATDPDYVAKLHGMLTKYFA